MQLPTPPPPHEAGGDATLAWVAEHLGDSWQVAAVATSLGVQPLLTLLVTERTWSARRMAGLLLALGGLSLVVGGADARQVPMAGLGYAFAALLSMTLGAIGQKRLNQSPIDTLPMQNAVRLSAREFALLQALMLRPGAILSRTELEERIYGWGHEVASNAVEFLIHALRKKLGAQAIKNVRGVGWMVPRGQ